MAEILLRLSQQIDAAIPQLVLFALCRKLVFLVCSSMVTIFTWSSIARLQSVERVRKTYLVLEQQLELAWATLSLFALSYYLVDTVSSLDDFLNCKPRSLPRPLGIFCAIALCCFVFTCRLSTSSTALVCMFLARERSALTGFASTITLATWSGQRGSSVLMVLCSLLSLTHFGFCRPRSSAVLSALCIAWTSVWAWQFVVFRALRSSKRN